MFAVNVEGSRLAVLTLETLGCVALFVTRGLRPRKANASATREKHTSSAARSGYTASVVFRELREAHDRTTARWPTAPWMLARAFTSVILTL